MSVMAAVVAWSTTNGALQGPELHDPEGVRVSSACRHYYPPCVTSASCCPAGALPVCRGAVHRSRDQKVAAPPPAVQSRACGTVVALQSLEACRGRCLDSFVLNLTLSFGALSQTTFGYQS